MRIVCTLLCAQEDLPFNKQTDRQYIYIILVDQAEDENSLYFIVRTGRSSLQQTVDDWIEEYKVSLSQF